MPNTRSFQVCFFGIVVFRKETKTGTETRRLIAIYNTETPTNSEKGVKGARIEDILILFNLITTTHVEGRNAILDRSRQTNHSIPIDFPPSSPPAPPPSSHSRLTDTLND